MDLENRRILVGIIRTENVCTIKCAHEVLNRVVVLREGVSSGALGAQENPVENGRQLCNQDIDSEAINDLVEFAVREVPSERVELLCRQAGWVVVGRYEIRQF